MTAKCKNHLIFLLLVCFFINIKSYLIGVDLGSEFFKATMLKPKHPFTMVENIQSKTKTPSAMAFKEDERTFGADAIAKKPKMPQFVLTFFNNYLENSESIKNHIDEAFISYNIIEDQERQTVEFKINFDKIDYTMNIEEVYGMLFRYIKYLADKFSGSDISELVVTVPNHYDYIQRQRIVQAVQLSKLNLLSLVSENVAAAVQFAQNKQFNSTEYFVFYNMGSSYTQATLVSFLSKFEVKNNKTVEVAKTLKVVDEAWEKDLGGNRMNYNLVRLLMDKFDNQANRKDKKSVKGDYKVAERILPSAVKYKEILSANKETPVTIIGVEGGMNVETRLTREEFEEANKVDLERVFNPIDKLMKRSSLKFKNDNDTEINFGWQNITAVELIGGGVRVPKVQEVLRAKMFDNSHLIGTHMNGDDSMAFGAAFICANFSSKFKQPVKMELYHGPNYELRVNLKNLPNATVCKNDADAENSDDQKGTPDCHQKLDKNTTIYKIRQGLDVARTVGFKFDQDFIVELVQKFDDMEEIKIFTYTVNEVAKVLELMRNDKVFENSNGTVTPKINLRFKQDFKGQVSLKVDATYEVLNYFGLHTGPNGGQELIYSPNFTPPIPEDEIKTFEESLKQKNMTESERKTLVRMRRDVGKTQKQERKIPLSFTVEEHLVKALNDSQMKEAKSKLDKFDEIDKNRIKTMETRNSLETIIYAKKEWLDGEKPRIFAKDADELKNASEGLDLISSWYDDEAFSANYETLDGKLKEVKNLFKVFEDRESNQEKRSKLEEKFVKLLKKYKDEARNYTTNRDWIELYYNNTFVKNFESIENWFKENKEKQDKLAPYEEEMLTADQINIKLKEMKWEFEALKRVPKPKPKIPEENIKIDDLMKNFTNLEDLIVSQ
jgi:hypoxia up-regulated 1